MHPDFRARKIVAISQFERIFQSDHESSPRREKPGQAPPCNRFSTVDYFFRGTNYSSRRGARDHLSSRSLFPPFSIPLKNPDSEDTSCLGNNHFATLPTIICSAAKIYAGKRRAMRQRQKGLSAFVHVMRHASLIILLDGLFF